MCTAQQEPGLKFLPSAPALPSPRYHSHFQHSPRPNSDSRCGMGRDEHCSAPVSTRRLFAPVVVTVVAVVTLVSGALRTCDAQPMCYTDRPLVTKINKMYQENFGFDGLVHITLAGSVHHGTKGVEVWLQTFAPGYTTNIRSQEQDTVVVALKGEGSLRSRHNGTDLPSPTPFSTKQFRANSTVVIPRNTVYQLVNSGKKRLQFLFIFGKPPIRFKDFEQWDQPKGKKVFPGPFDRKCLPGSFFGGHRPPASREI
eukprot:TRINITY_DN28390_c0_g1_i1.p1 TRINITY_DN28390_c0_g1~~TRINITY_DN28390_c0_g1_i1.p1  ORF type:complete len:279 (+),score=-11.90 TRINITY_DN28390_c0_g1_i1:73-837(+)